MNCVVSPCMARPATAPLTTACSARRRRNSVQRHPAFRPRRMIEMGSEAQQFWRDRAGRNRAEGSDAKHICIEPYSAPWLEDLGLTQLIRNPVETLDHSVFQQLDNNDICSLIRRTGAQRAATCCSSIRKSCPGCGREYSCMCTTSFFRSNIRWPGYET